MNLLSITNLSSTSFFCVLGSMGLTHAACVVEALRFFGAEWKTKYD